MRIQNRQYLDRKDLDYLDKKKHDAFYLSAPMTLLGTFADRLAVRLGEKTSDEEREDHYFSLYQKLEKAIDNLRPHDLVPLMKMLRRENSLDSIFQFIEKRSPTKETAPSAETAKRPISSIYKPIGKISTRYKAESGSSKMEDRNN